MGLLEKALDYKKEINRKGKITLLDTIKGPAETEMLNDEIDTNTLEKHSGDLDKSAQDANDDSSDDLFELPEDDKYSPLDTLKQQKGEKATESPDLIKIDSEINNKKKEKPIPSQHDNNPLTSDDNPILPKDIDALMSTKSKIDSKANGLIELEPYIISEDNYDNKDLEEDIIDEPASSKDLSTINKDEKKLKNNGEPGNISPEKYQENMTLYEIGKEISRSETKKVLFEIVIFSIMGQIGTSAASIMIKSPENDKWIIVNSSGLKSTNKTFSFEASTGIFKSIKKDIIDIEKYKNDPDYNEYYKELTSISAKLLIPWVFKGKVLGILALGAKITDDDYTAKEKDFIQAICEASAIELNKINTIEKIKTEYEVSKTGLDFLQRIINIQEKIIPYNSIKKIKDVIISELIEIGIIRFSVFAHDLTQDKYIPIITSNEEVHDPELAIDDTNAFISFINKKVNNPRIEDFNKLEAVKSTFKETEIKKMNILWVYSVVIGVQLLGYTAIFKVNDELLNEEKKIEIDNNLDKLSKMILLNITNIIRIDPDENRYTDNIGILFKRINSELENAKKLTIPLTLIIFSIKNYKRYGNLFGYAKAKELIDNFGELIKSRLSETDFSARYDRNKILIVFPGKDKKFAEPFANTIRNEFMQRFKKSEMQLLITFLLAGFPEDGDDLLSLVDSID